jgi:exo-beta-1,3-glucanase (GH17 family)
LARNRTQSITAAAVVMVVALAGVHLLIGSHAQTPYISSYAADGNLSGSTTLVPGGSDSSGQAVQFGGSGSDATAAGTPGITLGTGDEQDFTSAASAATQMALMKAAGVQWLRFDAYSGYPYDAEVKAAIANGINVSIVVEPLGTTTASAMSTWATEDATHFMPMGVHTYEILNEPNGCENPNLTAVQYVPILQAGYTAIKAVDPASTVLSAGLCPNSGANEPYTYLTAMYADSAKGYFDAFNDHAYSFPDTALQTSDGWNPWSYLPQLHSIMAANGDGNKKIWITEDGCPSDSINYDCNESTEATQITDAFQQARSSSYNTYLGPLLIFNWWDSSDGPYGLFTSSGVAKPALAAYEAAAK